MIPLRVFIGYDANERQAVQVLAHSIVSRASVPVAIIPLLRGQLWRLGFTRKRGPLESTDFSISRFLVPWLSRFEGFSIFLDCDMLCLTDIFDVVRREWWDRAVWCVKHDYTPKSETKFLAQPNRTYRCKNWSSLMVFNNAECKALTPEYVNTANGLELHQFFWLGKDGEERIGELPREWNWLVGEYPANPDAKILHFTQGGPWFEQYRHCDHADLWFAERDAAYAAQNEKRETIH